MLFKKSKRIKLTFHTCEKTPFADILSPAKATSMYPDWFKNISPKTDIPSMRSCPGYIELFKKSIAIPLWRDFEITYQNSQIKNISVARVSPDNVYHYVQHHHPEQWGGGFPNQPHLKLMNPWLITCDSMTPFLITEASWHKTSNDYTIPQGIVEFRLNTGSHVNMFLSESIHEKTILLEAGTPIVYLTPLEDVEVDIEIKEISNEKWTRLLNYNFSFKNNYKKTLNLFRKRNG
jgi:hypothetical protein